MHAPASMAALTTAAAGWGTRTEVPALPSTRPAAPPGAIGDTVRCAALPLGVAASLSAADADGPAGGEPLCTPSTEITAFDTASASASAGAGTDTIAQPLLRLGGAALRVAVSVASAGPPCCKGSGSAGMAPTYIIAADPACGRDRRA